MNFDESMTCVKAHFKTKAALAKLLGVTRQSVQSWEQQKKIPASMAIKIEKLTNGEIKAVDIV